MARKPITKIIKEVKALLEKEGELSIRQISIKLGSQWRTIEKALETMKSLEIAKERKGDKRDRIERLFSLEN